MADIRKFAVEETSVVELVEADETPMFDEKGGRMTITIYGPGSKQYARANAVRTNRYVETLSKRRGKQNKPAEVTRRESAEFLTACTKEFSPNIEYEGLTGEALYFAVYNDPKIGFIAEQVSKHLEDWANFQKPSTTSSGSTSGSTPG